MNLIFSNNIFIKKVTNIFQKLRNYANDLKTFRILINEIIN